MAQEAVQIMDRREQTKMITKAVRHLVAAGFLLLILSPPAWACKADPFDAAAEVAALKAAYPQAKIPTDRKAMLDDLMTRIDISTARLGLQGLAAHSELRGKALSILALERTPRWPREKVEAIRASKHGGELGLAAIRAAEVDWGTKRYAAANAHLDQAIANLKIKLIIPRC